MTGALCSRCGAVLDLVHLDAGQHRHPRCDRDTTADATGYARALAVLAGVFPTARRCPDCTAPAVTCTANHRERTR